MHPEVKAGTAQANGMNKALGNVTDIRHVLRKRRGNQQEGNDPLDIGLNALETTCKGKHGSDLSLSAFAGRLGKTGAYMTQVSQAARVFREILTQVKNFNADGRTKHLTEIHSAPSTTWPTLAALLQDHDWSVKDTKAAVERIKSVAESIPEWWPDLSDGWNSDLH